MDITVILFTIFIIVILYLYSRKYGKASIINEIPGPYAYPFIGNSLEALTDREKFLDLLTDRRRTFGPLYRTWLGPLPAVHIASPENTEVILGSNKYITKGLLYKFLYPWLGKGLLTSNGKKWFTHRKIITPTFHFKILDTFLDVYWENSEILVKKLKKKAETGEEFDIYPFISLCTLDIICETAMGTKVNAQDQDQSPYVASIYKLSVLTTVRAVRLWLHPDLIFKNSPTGKEYQKNLDVVHGFTDSVIKERKRLRKTRKASATPGSENEVGIKKRVAFLDLLLDASAENQEQSILSDQDLREEVDTFMFEGHDTTTAGIGWALLLLGHNPKIQEDVYEEMRSIFGDDPTRPITMKDLNEMKLLERVIKETLRLYPSVPIISRLMEEDIKLGKYVVPRGTTTVLHIYQMHRDPQIYPNPDIFNPDRFLPENMQKRHPYSYVPFSAGPRNCIGQKFALLEEKVVLSTLIRNYKFEALEKREDLVVMLELILRPKSGIRMKITKRN